MRGNTSPVDASDSSPPPGAPIAPASAARAAARRVGRAERLSCGEAAARLRGWRRRVQLSVSRCRKGKRQGQPWRVMRQARPTALRLRLVRVTRGCASASAPQRATPGVGWRGAASANEQTFVACRGAPSAPAAAAPLAHARTPKDIAPRASLPQARPHGAQQRAGETAR